MNSPSSRCPLNSPSAGSPSYRHITLKHKHSPIELKEKMRKTYKDKVQNCRNMLLNRLRGTETDLRETLTDIYKSMFSFSADTTITDEENIIMEEIRNELVQEELQWWLEEHEKSQTENVDWSTIEQEDNVICPVCQKVNLKLDFGTLTCLLCKFNIQTQKSLIEIKKSLNSCIEAHGTLCNNQVLFTNVTEVNESHIYLICDSCMEMRVVV
ncbi:RPA-interacting protein-like [Leguminivora glycinivorella]|uniref:RPA-interacting protein-like n=1 Tax=Leguminivora glycinivorella TaxID=1035111 RepID=UPI00200DA45B|nr:RPA-interacting protein-like [Leguminivora glycinivorella]